jgi:hypothetical protein
MSRHSAHSSITLPSHSLHLSQLTSHRWSITRQNIFVVFLGMFLLLDQLFPASFHSKDSLPHEIFELQTPEEPDLKSAEISRVLSFDEQESDGWLKQVDGNLTFLIDLSKTAEKDQKSMKEINIADVADRFKVLLELQWLQDQLDSPPSIIPKTVLDERKERLQVTFDNLWHVLMRWTNKSSKQVRTFASLSQHLNIERGILIPVGNNQFQHALHLVSTLKHVHKTSLPIQIVFAGNDDLTKERRAALGEAIPLHPLSH